MAVVSGGHLAGAIMTLAAISAIGVYSGRKVKSAADFNTGGGTAGGVIVAGTIMGTLIGGSSTIGTAEMAYSFGFSALWFLLGGSIGCLILSQFFVGPLRSSGCQTIQQMIGREYGQTAEFLSSILSSVGTLIAVVAQLLSATALLSAFLGLPDLVCTLIAIGVMFCYVAFGGVWGTGLVGSIKMVLIYFAILLGVALVLERSGSLAALYAGLDPQKYLNFFARGLGTDWGAALSIVLGLLSTQTYIQAVVAGKDEKTARQGALISGLVLPPIGIGGMLIGVFMAQNHPGINGGQAFPQFILLYLPPLAGGVILATLLIAIVGTGAGLALGISTIFTKTIYRTYICKGQPPKAGQELWMARAAIVAVLLFSLLFTLGDSGALILQWSIMSMALRAAAGFVPLCGALFFSGHIPKTYMLAAVVAGPLVVLAGELFLPLPGGSIFFGIFVAALICLAGGLQRKIKRVGPPA